jgi:hypothetical protein
VNLAVCCAIGLHRWIIAGRALQNHSSKAWGGGSEGEGVGAAGCRPTQRRSNSPLGGFRTGSHKALPERAESCAPLGGPSSVAASR